MLFAWHIGPYHNAAIRVRSQKFCRQLKTPITGIVNFTPTELCEHLDGNKADHAKYAAHICCSGNCHRIGSKCYYCPGPTALYDRPGPGPYFSNHRYGGNCSPMGKRFKFHRNFPTNYSKGADQGFFMVAWFWNRHRFCIRHFISMRGWCPQAFSNLTVLEPQQYFSLIKTQGRKL